MLQACFREHQAGRHLVNLCKWWLDCEGKAEPQAGLETSSPAIFVKELLHYLQETVLNPQFAAPEDLTYFGTTCFVSSMRHFIVHATAPEQDGAAEEMENGRGLSVFATCAGVRTTLS